MVNHNHQVAEAVDQMLEVPVHLVGLEVAEILSGLQKKIVEVVAAVKFAAESVFEEGGNRQQTVWREENFVVVVHSLDLVDMFVLMQRLHLFENMSSEEYLAEDLQGKVEMMHLKGHNHQVQVLDLSDCYNCFDLIGLEVVGFVFVLWVVHIHLAEILLLHQHYYHLHHFLRHCCLHYLHHHYYLHLQLYY